MILWKKIALVSVLTLVAIQGVGCERKNPPVLADFAGPPAVKAVMQRACYDCHSNETSWPWYTRLAPASWMIHRDVMDGRDALNFSDWETLPVGKQSELQTEIGEEVASGSMPPRFYLPLHAHATLSDADKIAIQAWSTGPRQGRTMDAEDRNGQKMH
jgi:hypothetical protein